MVADKTIAVLERTLGDKTIASGPALVSALRQLNIRREERDLAERSRRENSVIVFQSSTPTLSPNTASAEGQTEPLFLGGNTSSIDPQDQSTRQQTFEIYIDPSTEERPRQPLRQIEIVDTPNSATSIGQENIPPHFLFPRRIMSENGEADEEKRKEMSTKLCSQLSKLKGLVELYDPNKHDPAVLKAREEKWLGKVEGLYEEFLDVFGELGMLLDNEEDKRQAQDLMKEAKDMVEGFTISYTMKAISIGTGGGDGDGGGSANNDSNTQAVRVTKANIDKSLKTLSGKTREERSTAWPRASLAA